MRITLMTLLSTLVLTATGRMCADDKAEVEKELKKFQGTWTFVSVVAGGKEVPIDAFKGITVTFEKDRYAVKKDDMVIEAATQKLDPSRSPRTLDVTVTEGPNKGAVMLGIYEISGDTLKVCFDPEGKKRPTQFKSEAGAQTLVVHRRVLKEPVYHQAQQQYLRLLLGQKPTREFWVVRDGFDFYIDRNGNGDLTELGEKVTATKPMLGSYVLIPFGNLRDAHGVEHSLEVLLELNSGVMTRVTMAITKKYKQNARLVPLRTTQANACVLHFDGPLSSGLLANKLGTIGPLQDPETFKLRRGKNHYLSTWVGTPLAGSPPVFCGDLDIPEDDPKKHPRLVIVFEPRDPKASPLMETYLLTNEAPGLYSRRNVLVPTDAGDRAKITLTFPTLPVLRAYEIEVKVID